MTYYKNKSDFHRKEWKIAQDAGKKKAAAHHMREYLNYQEMIKMSNQ